MNSQQPLGKLLKGISKGTQPRQMYGRVKSVGSSTVDVVLEGDGALLQRKSVIGGMPAREQRVLVQEVNGAYVVFTGGASTGGSGGGAGGVSSGDIPATGTYLPLSGGTLTGNLGMGAGLTLDGVDLSAFKAAYDAFAGVGYLPLAGGNLTGNVTANVGVTLDGVDLSVFKTAYDALVLRTITAGTGLTGGGDLSASRTINVGAGTGILANADDVAINQAFTPTWTGAHLFQATMTTRGVNPETGYGYDIGMLSKKYLALYASELWVETLVAQDTLATIGGRLLIGATTILTSDLSATNTATNGGFETLGAGGADVFANWSEQAGTGAVASTTVGAEVHGGTYAAKLTRGATDNTILYRDITVVPGTGYYLSFWTRGDGTNAGRYQLYDISNATNLVAIASTGVTGTTYTKVSVNFSAPPGCLAVRLYFWAPMVNGGVAYFDDFEFIPALITVKHNQLAVNDIVYMEAAGKVEFMKVTGGGGGSAGAYTYTVARDLDGTGVNAWYAGDAVFNTGTTGDGFIDLYSMRSMRSATQYGPTIVGNVRTGTAYNNIAERWAIGNLNGLYGYGADTYGTAFGDPAGAWVKIEPTNGVRIGFNTTTNIQLDASGNASFTGAITATSGTISGLLRVSSTGNLMIGDGTVGSDFAGLRMFRSGATAYFAGYTSGVLDWYMTGDTTRLALVGRYIIFQPVQTGTLVQAALSVQGGAHTAIQAGTEVIDINLNLDRAVQHATGALTTQRSIYIAAPTYSFVGASTITNAATMYINGAPVAGANATITNNYALWIDAGNVRIDGTVKLTLTNYATNAAAITGGLVAGDLYRTAGAVMIVT